MNHVQALPFCIVGYGLTGIFILQVTTHWWVSSCCSCLSMRPNQDACCPWYSAHQITVFWPGVVGFSSAYQWFSEGWGYFSLESWAAHSFCGCPFCRSMEQSTSSLAALCGGGGLHVVGMVGVGWLGISGACVFIDFSIEMYSVALVAAHSFCGCPLCFSNVERATASVAFAGGWPAWAGVFSGCLRKIAPCVFLWISENIFSQQICNSVLFETPFWRWMVVFWAARAFNV